MPDFTKDGGIKDIMPQYSKHLVTVSGGDAGRTLLSDITKLYINMLSGNVNNKLVPFLYGARLCAFKRRDDGISPIAIG